MRCTFIYHFVDAIGRKVRKQRGDENTQNQNGAALITTQVGEEAEVADIAGAGEGEDGGANEGEQDKHDQALGDLYNLA